MARCHGWHEPVLFERRNRLSATTSPSRHYKDQPVFENTQAITIPTNRRRVRGGILATIGYLLSPLPWWNDLLMNIPFTYVFATIVGLVYRQWFVPALILGYWHEHSRLRSPPHRS